MKAFSFALAGAFWFAATLAAPSQPYSFSTLAGLAGATGSADGTNTLARFNLPHGVAVDSSNAFYVADTANHTVRKLTPAGTNWVTTTLAGLAGVSGATDGTNNAARFYFPFGVAVDKGRRLYVADTYNYTIRRITPVGTNWVVQTIAGSAGLDGTTDGTNNNARFIYPQGIAVDSATNLYVADYFAIRKLTPVGTNWVVRTIAGGQASGNADGTNNAARFYSPSSIAVDSATNLYVSDQDNYTLRKITPVGTNWVTTTIAGLAGAAGSADAANNAARFNFPAGLALDSATNLYVADYGNSTIRKVAPLGTNWVVNTLGGTAGATGSADGTNGSARFNYPQGVAVDSAGRVCVADTANQTIRLGINVASLACTAPPTGLVSWWRGEGNALDSVGTNNGTLFNAVSFAAAEVGNGFALSGGNAYVGLPQNLFPYPASGSGTVPFSFEVWFSTTVGGVILGQQNTVPFTAPSAYVPALYVGTDGKLYAAMFWNNFVFLASATTVTNGAFHHAAVTFSGTNEVLYLDGVAVGSTPFTQLGYTANYQYQLGTGYTAGGWPAGNGGWLSFVGILDEASLYNRALTSNEVAAIFQAGSAGKCVGPLAPAVLVAPQSQTLVAGATTSLSVVAAGTTPLSYHWQCNGTWMEENARICGCYSDTMTLARVSASDQGDYRVVVSNFAGSVTSSVARLTVLQPGCFAPPSGLVSWWRGEGNAADSAGTNPAALVNGAGFAPAEVGYGFALSGATDYVGLPRKLFALDQHGAPFSLELWFRTSRGGVILGEQTAAPFAAPKASVPVLYIGADGRLYAALSWSSSARMISPAAVNDGAFHHIALTFDGANSVLYLDGAGVGTMRHKPQPQVADGYWQLGTGYADKHWPAANGGWYSFSGLIDEVSLYGRALDAGEVAAIYRASSAGKCLAAGSYGIAGGVRASLQTNATTIMAGPALTLTCSGSNITLSWPADSSAQYRLFSTRTLASPDWRAVSPAPNLIGGDYRLTLPATGGAVYYRLQR